MPLKEPTSLQFGPHELAEALGPEAISQLLALARKSYGLPQESLLETFKYHFARRSCQEYSKSSNVNSAENDLLRLANRTAHYPHEFVAAFYNACEDLEKRGATMPQETDINRVLASSGCPYRIENGELTLHVDHFAHPSASLAPEDILANALKDATALLGHTGSSSAVDRLHTALHAYLRHLCSEAKITAPGDVTTTKLFELLRQQHPAFHPLSPHANEVCRILSSCTAVIDSLCTLRNHATLTHANTLLQNPEAAAVINATYTVFRYVQDSILRHSKKHAQRPNKNHPLKRSYREKWEDG